MFKSGVCVKHFEAHIRAYVVLMDVSAVLGLVNNCHKLEDES